MVEVSYLRRVLEHCIRLGPVAKADPTSEAATMLADLRDYLVFTTLDALKNGDEARKLVIAFTELEAWLAGRGERFYEGFLFGLQNVLTNHHGIALLPAERVDREAFERSWRKTREKLGLVEK